MANIMEQHNIGERNNDQHIKDINEDLEVIKEDGKFVHPYLKNKLKKQSKRIDDDKDQNVSVKIKLVPLDRKSEHKDEDNLEQGIISQAKKKGQNIVEDVESL